MISTSRLSLVAAAVALAGGFASTTAKADAVAQAILNVSNFHFALGNGNATRAADGSLLGAISVLSATTTADASVDLNGAAATQAATQTNPLSMVGASAQTMLGNSGSYVPGAALVGAPVATYAAATSQQGGNSLLATSSALTDGIVSLKPSGDGSTASNVNFQAEFGIAVLANGTKIEIAFDANSFLRGYLSTVGLTPPTATAATSFSLTVRDAGGATVFRWNPDGLLGSGISGGIEYADAFAMTDTASRLTPGNVVINNATGAFQAETFGLAAGQYTVSLRQTALTDGFLKLPEPASLGLLGIALVGAGVASRRRNK